MLLLVLKLKLKQTVGSIDLGSIMKFLAPDFLVGLFMALASANRFDPNFVSRVGVVSCGIALFTLIVETRKLFFSGGDIEDFYFVLPTIISRFASFFSIVILNSAVIGSILLPLVIVIRPETELLFELMSISLSAIFLSSSTFFALASVIALGPGRIANITLTILQIAFALVLLAVFQIPSLAAIFPVTGNTLVLSLVSFMVVGSIFLIFPFQEKLIANLKEREFSSRSDFLSLIEKTGKIFFMKEDEEEAGFLFFLTQISRNHSFRLSAIGTAATPVMVAIYWILRGEHFINIHPRHFFFTAGSIAPLASLVTSGILVHYFLSQSLLASRDYEASWIFKAAPAFSFGKFVFGIRKAFSITVHFSMTVAVFIVAIQQDSIVESLLTAVTFYFLVHVSFSWFLSVQKDLPFSVPFTQIGTRGIVDLIFMICYSILVTFILFISYGSVRNLLLVNLFAFILIRMFDLFSVGIIDKRMKAIV